MKLEERAGEPAKQAQAGASQQAGLRFALAVAAVAMPRLLTLPFAQDFYGDAVVRGELASRFAASPRFFGSFAQGVFQFGPLQLYLMGALDWLGVARDNSGRLTSLFFGCLTVWPLWALSRRLFDARAALLACLGLAAWGMHVQFSTTGGSESMALFFICATVAAFARALELDERVSLLGSALLLTLACSIRYDAWLLIPFLSVVWVVVRGIRSWPRALLFGVCSSAFPLAWLHGNWGDMGDPLYPLKYIEDFHRNWFADGDKRWGVTMYRLQNLFFWPGAAVVTLSPGVAVLGAVGVVHSWRSSSKTRWLIALIVLPALWLTVRSTMLGTFVPLARFTAKELLFLLPFVGAGAAWVSSKLPKPVWRAAAALTALLAIAWPVWLGVYTYDRNGRGPDSLRPISPITTQPREVTEAIGWLLPKLADGSSLALDSDAAQYEDLLVAFRSGLPEDRLARYRWDTFWVHYTSRPPRYLLRFEGGELERGPLHLEGAVATLGTLSFTEAAHFGAVHLYAR